MFILMNHKIDGLMLVNREKIKKVVPLGDRSSSDPHCKIVYDDGSYDVIKAAFKNIPLIFEQDDIG